ncbi:hypothetical protein PRUPE_3G003300 [Prunus persica]|uniref:DUF7705 domain-containing protein n=1 Tax=Prunus persica TaxID=3760 RepID=A0A251PUE3_PRUPE|nr:hypothetical protein PRUPE_3G003300 [Prunus persica]
MKKNQMVHVSLFLAHVLLLISLHGASGKDYISAVGDPGMRRDELRVALEAWNFCNEVGAEAPGMGSPRAADCFNLTSSSLRHGVSEDDNKLGVGTPFPGISQGALNNVDLYAAEKELYLGSLCQVSDSPKPWQFWMVMLKNGNFDTKSGLCPANGKKAAPFSPGKFPCFGSGCMNQPIVNHQETELLDGDKMRGSFSGSYDLGSDLSNGNGGADGISFYEVVWQKKLGVGSWVFSHKLKTSKKYPWLMLYLRADATQGYSGGYHYDTRGMLKTLPESPNFKVRLTLDIKQGGGPKSQFYLIDIGSCWKNNGQPCNGDVLTDVTRYTEMIINPETPAWCSPTGNAKHLEQPVSTCDPYSNPQAQEIMQLLPHPIWAEYGYPTKQGQGWVGDARTWELDVGALSSRLYFYQDPGTTPARRIWGSVDVGTEIFVSDKDEVAEWTLSDFDVIFTPKKE